jgi:hypothetical protein
MRFNPTADWPWAHGPALQGLPTLRQVDELERQYLEATERSYNPAITFPDDSFAEVEQGIEPGMAYPIRPGSADAVKAIYNQPNVDREMFTIETMEKRLRKLFFVDYPGADPATRRRPRRNGSTSWRARSAASARPACRSGARGRARSSCASSFCSRRPARSRS